MAELRKKLNSGERTGRVEFGDLLRGKLLTSREVIGTYGRKLD